MQQHRPSCIVLGGGGFLGTNLCRRLAASGLRVRAFGRTCLFPDEMAGAEWYPGDFTDTTSLAAAIDSFDIVFHLIHATMPQTANLDMAGDLTKNVLSSLSLIDICHKLKVKRLVFVSSGGTIYGCPQQIPTPETAPTEPISAYGISKLAIEKYLALHERLHQSSYRILRVTNPFGPFQIPRKNQGVIAALLSRAINGEKMEIWGDGSVIRDFIFVDDVVDALEAAAKDQSDERIFNIGSGQGRALHDVIGTIENLLGKKLEINWKPGRLIDVPMSVVAIDRAKQFLDWAPRTSFEAGLKQTLQWWEDRR